MYLLPLFYVIVYVTVVAAQGGSGVSFVSGHGIGVSPDPNDFAVRSLCALSDFVLKNVPTKYLANVTLGGQSMPFPYC